MYQFEYLEPLAGDPLLLILSIFLLDQLFGDPDYPLHPLRLTARVLSTFERALVAIRMSNVVGSALLVAGVVGVCVVWLGGAWVALRGIHWALGWIWTAYVGFSMFRFRSQCREARAVAIAIDKDDLGAARVAVEDMLSRDVERMDANACNRAAVEVLCEGFVRGAIAPLFYFFLFGIPGMVLVQVVGVVESIAGYSGAGAERLDRMARWMDTVLMFIPCRLAWFLMSIAAAIIPGLSPLCAFEYGFAARKLVPGFNSGWTQGAAAGALHVRLGGPIWIGHKLISAQWLGELRDPDGAVPRDIDRIIMLLYTAVLLLIVFGYATRAYWPGCVT